MSEFYTLLQSHSWLYSTVCVGALLLLAFLVNALGKFILLRTLRHLSRHLDDIHNQDSINRAVAARLANILPIVLVSIGITLLPDLPDTLVKIARNVAFAFIVLSLAIAISHLLDFLNVLYMRKNGPQSKPIKGYIQVLKLVIALVAGILILASLIDQSPLILLSGLGAMAAVLMLIFQDTILSLVASIQINASGMVRIGDWIEIPQLNVDGFVIDIALHNVTVQNWDKTYSIFPTKRLISESFKNWRGMEESGGRRIKRSLHLDQTSVHFLTDSDIAELKKLVVLDNYLKEKDDELKQWNTDIAAQGKDTVNMRRLTNLGTFRAYIDHYLRNHPEIHQELLLSIRQLQPTATGIPLEIYCFTKDVRFVAHENIQADIFDHLLAILPVFGLRVFQQPSGFDLSRIHS